MNFITKFFVAILVFVAVCSQAIDVNSVVQKAQAVDVKNYPDANYILIYDLQEATYQENGQDVEIDEYFSLVVNEKGREELRTINCYFNPFYGNVEVQKLAVIRNGKSIPVDIKKNSRINVDASQMSANIYDPNNKILSVTIPDLQIGDIVHTKIVNTTLKPRIPNVWCGYYTLQSTAPILEYIIKINAPKSLPLQSIAVKDSVNDSIVFNKLEKDNRIIYTWRASNVPQVFPEEKMPKIYTCVQRLLVSTVKSWSDISKWYYNLCRPRLDAVSPEMKEMVEKLTKDLKSPQEKINKIFQFVSQNIRYMGITPEQETPGMEPHDVSMTFKNRYGVCRDKAVLLVSMLELAGIKAFPVLFMSGAKKDIEVPNNYFNHAITAAQVKDGEYILMDPTFETTTELFPAALSNMSYLVARKEGETLMTSPSVKAEENMIKIAGEGDVSNSGQLTYKANIQLFGVNDQVYRDAFSRWPNEYRRQFFSARLKHVVPGVELKNLEILPVNVRDMSHPLQINISFVAPYALKASGLFPLQNIAIGDVIGVANNVLGDTWLEQRKYPMQIYSTCGIEESSIISFPKFISVVDPKELKFDIKSPALNFKAETTFKDNKLTSNSTLTVDLLDISPKDYRELKTASKSIEYAKKCYLLANDFNDNNDFKTVYPNAYAVILLDDISRNFKADMEYVQTQTLRIKVLSYTGVKKMSELKVTFTPEFENVTIKNATVIDPDGTKHPLTDKEINFMDTGVNKSAPRYPAQKMLIANFPGVKVDSIIEYTIEKVSKNPWGNHFADSFGSFLPILEKRLQIKTSPNIAITQSSNPENTSLKNGILSAKNIAPIPNNIETADFQYFVPTKYSSNTTYKLFAKLLLTNMQKLSKDQKLATAKALELTTEAKNTKDKLLIIRDFVARNIRLSGSSFINMPLSAMTPADITLKDGYGNSLDRAILLMAMLYAVDIKSTPFAVSNLVDCDESENILESNPQVKRFNNILLNIKIDNRSYFINDSSEYDYLGSTDYDEHIALNLEEGDLTTIDAAEANIEQYVDIDIALKNDGSALVKIKERFLGANFGTEKERFAKFTPENLKRYVQKLVYQVSPSAQIVGEVFTNFDNYPGILRYSVNIPDFVKVNGVYRQIELPWFLDVTQPLNIIDAKRDNPFARNKNIEFSYSWNISIPTSWKVVSMPQNIRQDSRLESVVIEFNQKPHSISSFAKIEAKAGILSPLEYSTMAEIQSKCSELTQRVIILKTEDK